MNKYLLAHLVPAVTMFSAYCANDNMHSNRNGKTTSANMSPYQQAQSRMITPPAAPVVKGGADVFFDADFIYWTARQGGQAFAWQNSTPETTAIDNSTFAPGNTVNVNNKYSPGFKVGLGTVLAHDGWDLYLQYTWFRTNPTSDTVTGYLAQEPYLSNILFFSNRAPFADPANSFRQLRAQWKLRYNDFKLELGRNYYISQKLQIRNHVGLRGGWQTQRYNTYATLTEPSGGEFGWTQADYRSRNKNYYWTIGLRAGLDTSWMFTQNWSIFGDFALSALWTQFTYTRQDFATTTGSTDPADNASNFQTLNQRDKIKQVTPVIELTLGLRFDWWFSDDDYRFRLEAGWENQVWFDTNKLETMTTQQRNLLFRNGNLSLQGLTIKARFDF